MNKGVRRALYGVIVLLLVALVAMIIIVLTRPPEKVEPGKVKRTPVRVLEVAPRDLPDVLTLAGRIEAWRSARLSASRAGTVTALLADKGSAAAEGQVLARVDHRVWEAAAARARADQEDAERQFRRLQALHAEGAVSSNDLDNARARDAMSRAALAEAEAFLSQCSVTAPFAGVINNRFVELGDYVAEGASIFELVQTSRVKVALDVPEKDVGFLAPDRPMTFTVSADGQATHTGRVAFVASAASRSSNAFRVELEMDNPAGTLRPGMLADVAVPRGTHSNRIVLPLDAVLPVRGERVVFVVENGHALRRVVKLASLVGSEAVIESGVSPGERVVIEGQRSLADGVPVDVR